MNQVQLGDISTIRLGQAVKETPSPQGKGVRLIRIKEIVPGNFDDIRDLPYADISNNDVKLLIAPYDIVLPIRGLRMDAMLLNRNNEDVMTTNHVAVIRCHNDRILPNFCLWYLNSPAGQQALANQRKGATSVPQISLKDLMSIHIPLPSFDVQMKISSLYNNWLAQKNIYKQIMLNGDELTLSVCNEILQKGE
ncbi:TPA: restriction endonuclease subunit S [Photobacterium damselae]